MKIESAKYKITFRKLNASDINVECPFLPGTSGFEMHLQAIIQDINGFAGITDVFTHDELNLIITTQDVDLQTLKADLKPLLQQYFQYLRVSSIVTL